MFLISKTICQSANVFLYICVYTFKNNSYICKAAIILKWEVANI